MRPALLLLALCGTASAIWPFSGGSDKAGAAVEVGPNGEVMAAGADPSADRDSVGEPAANRGKVRAEDTQGSNGKVSVLFRNDAATACDVFWDDGSYGVAVAHKVEARGSEVSVRREGNGGGSWVTSI